MEITPELLDAVHGELVKGAWPTELAMLVGAPDHRWRGWMAKGAEDAAEGTQSPEAELYSMIARSRHRLEQGYRQGMAMLALDGKNWQVFAWLLARLSPRTYSERVLENTEAEVLRLLKVVQESTDPDTYGAIVAALEQARAAGNG